MQDIRREYPVPLLGPEGLSTVSSEEKIWTYRKYLLIGVQVPLSMLHLIGHSILCNGADWRCPDRYVTSDFSSARDFS